MPGHTNPENGASAIDFLARRLVSLRAIHWHGPLPSPGDFLKTEKGLTAYEIVSIRENMRPDPRSRAVFKCWRIPASEIPADGHIHAWRWSARG